MIPLLEATKKPVSAVITVKIRPSGEVWWTDIPPSKNDEFDGMALSAIEASKPFAPLPAAAYQGPRSLNLIKNHFAVQPITEKAPQGANEMSYHPLSNETGGTADDRRSEADRILAMLEEEPEDHFTRKELDFIGSMRGECYVSVKQLFWLRDIKDKHQ